MGRVPLVEARKPSINSLTLLEIVPMLCMLIFVILALAFFPTLDPVKYAVRQDIDIQALENVLNNTALGKP